MAAGAGREGAVGGELRPHIHDYEPAKRSSSAYFAAFPDLTHTARDVIAEGEKVVTRYTVRGTHRRETQDFGPPTGRHRELEGITIRRFEDGKMVGRSGSNTTI